jgi:hypothetical protein
MSVPCTPKKPPAFQSRAAYGTPSPRKTQSSSASSLASGCELILRGVLNPTLPLADPVPIVQDLVNDIMLVDPDLAGVPVLVKPFHSGRKTEPSSTCYIRLHSSFDPTATTGPLSEPRCDLLRMWRDSIRTNRPQWEVAWSPQIAGKDKRLWVRFPDVIPRDPTSKDGAIPADTINKVKGFLEGQGFPTLGHFSNQGGLVFTLIDPAHVDQIIAQRSLKVPGFPLPLTVLPGCQLEIEHAFELVIMGVNDYEGIFPHLEEWLVREFAVEGVSNFAGWRNPPEEPDTFVFRMCTWEATSAVLKAKTAFLEFFAEHRCLCAPQAVFTLNSDGPWRKNLREDFAKGATTMNEGMSTLSRRMDQMQREMRQNSDAVQVQLSAISTNVTRLSNHVGQIGNELANQRRALMAASQESAISRKLTLVQTQLLAARQDMRYASSDEERMEARAEIERLHSEERTIKGEFESAGNRLDALLRSSIGLTIEAPPQPQ